MTTSTAFRPRTDPLSDYGRRSADYRRRLGISRLDGSPAARRGYVAEALADIAAHADERGLKRHQCMAVDAVARHIQDFTNSATALVTIPTGGGKTRAFQTIVSALGTMDRKGRNFVPNTLVLVPTRVLIRQTYCEFRKVFPWVDVVSASSTPLVDEDGDPIPMGIGSTTLMTYKAFTEAAERGDIRPEDVDLLVMDEAHRGLSDLRRQVLRPFLDECVVTAWTATPAFDDQKSVQNLLGPENEVYSITAQELRERDVIAPMINYVMSINVEGDVDSMDASSLRAARRTALVEGVLDFVATHVDEETGLDLAGKIAIFYGADRAHAAEFAAEYNRRLAGRGLRMEVLTGEDSSDHIRTTLDRVRRGEVTAIGNASLLAEGFDFPQIGLVINSPTESLVRVLQQAGRMQRFDPSIPVFDPRQTSFVIDTYYKINGRILGRPRFVFEALGDPGCARLVEGGRVTPSGTSGTDPARGDGCADYVVYSEMESIIRMLRDRDRLYGPAGPEWLRLAEVRAMAPRKKSNALSDAWFDLQGMDEPQISDGPIRFELRLLPTGCAVYRLHSGDLQRFLTASGVVAAEWRMGRIVPAEPDEDHVCGRIAVSRAIGTDPYSEKFDGFMEEIEDAAYSALRDVTPGTAPGMRVEVRGSEFEVRLVRSGFQTVWAYRAADMERIAGLIGLVNRQRSEGDGWTTRFEIMEKRFVTPESRVFFDALDDAFHAEIDGTHQTEAIVSVRGRDFRLALRRIGNVGRVCYRAEDAETLRRMSGIPFTRPQKQPGMLSRKEITSRIGGRSGVTDAIFKSIEAEIAAMERLEIPEGPILRDGMVIDAVSCLAGTAPVVCFQESDVDKLVKLIGRPPPIPEGWMTRRDCKLATAAAGRSRLAFLTGWHLIGQSVDAGETISFEGRAIRAARHTLEGGKSTICIHPEDFAVFVDLMDFHVFNFESRHWIDAGRGLADAKGIPLRDADAACQAVLDSGIGPDMECYRKRIRVRFVDIDRLVEAVRSLDKLAAPGM